MKEEDRNSRQELSDLMRYNRDNLSGKERNSIEREFQKDPFAEEAVEGLGSIGPEEAAGDLRSLNKRLSHRITRTRRLVIYRIAASVAVLMTIGSVYLIVKREKPVITNLEIAYSAPILKSDESEKLSQESPAPIAGIKAAATEEKKAVNESKKQAAEPLSEPVLSVEESNARVVSDKAEKQEAGGEVKSDKAIVMPKLARQMEEVAVKPTGALQEARGADVKFALSGKVSGIVISSDDKSPLPGVAIVDKKTNTGTLTDVNGNFTINITDEKDATLTASYIGMETREFRANPDSVTKVEMNPAYTTLAEVVTVGYGVKKGEAEPDFYTPPEPEGGRKYFNDYLSRNKINPDTTSIEKRKTVVIKFTVTAEGKIEDIRITKTPGNAYSEEARRLIADGPGWKPAIKDGKAVDDIVTLRITFK